jgi:hypothetical protein
MNRKIKAEVDTPKTRISIQMIDKEKYILNLNDKDAGYVEYELNQENIEELYYALQWIKKQKWY